MSAAPDPALVVSRHSLRHVLAVILVAGMLLPSLLLTGWTLYTTHTQDRPRQLQAAMVQYARLLTPALTQLLWNLDRDGTRQLLDDVVDGANLQQVAVYDDKGQRWVEVAAGALVAEAHVLRATYPLTYGDTRIGEFAITLTDTPVRQGIRQSLQRQLLVLALQLVVAVSLVLWFFNRRVFQPLQALGDVARQIGSGQLDHPVPRLRDDELGRLAQQIEHMRLALNQSFADISALNVELEQRVEKRTAELAQANRQLENTIAHLNTAQNELVKNAKLIALGSLVAGISHELNTPIGNALTVATALQAQVQDFVHKLDQPLRKHDLQAFMDTVSEGSTLLHVAMLRAAELIRHFKQLAVDQTSARRRVFVLADTVNEVLTSIQPQLRKTRHKLDVDIPAGIEMDSYPGALTQILLNLIDNALQHAFDTQPEGRMQVQARRLPVEVAPAAVAMVELLFSDNGCGIAAAHLPRIFDPFFTTRLGKGGSGLGLNIVYNIVNDVLGGRIDVDSAPGKGTRFIITLPLLAPQHH